MNRLCSFNFMEDFPGNKNYSCLELSIATPAAFSSSPSLQSFGESGGNTTRMKELDINQVPSPGLFTEQIICMEEEEEEDEIPNGESPDLNPSPNPRSRKKLRLSKQQSRLLEESFRQNQTLNPKQKESLAEELKLKARQVEVWFQNRRARSKMKQAEMECQYLRRWFGTLTEQNRRLHKEVEELRAINGGRRHHPPPSSAFTMCPCCQRVIAVDEVAPAAANFQFLQPRYCG